MKALAILLTSAAFPLTPIHAAPIELREKDVAAFVGGKDVESGGTGLQLHPKGMTVEFKDLQLKKLK